MIINFGALGIGKFLMSNEAKSEWYLSLNKAPWTPPGWVFGLAWGTIMICFSIYMTQLYTISNTTPVLILFLVQVFLNIGWNYTFFNQHKVGLGLVIITLLTLLLIYFLVAFYSQLQLISLLIIPYVLWLVIATSLNYYIFSKN